MYLSTLQYTIISAQHFCMLRLTKSDDLSSPAVLELSAISGKQKGANVS